MAQVKLRRGSSNEELLTDANNMLTELYTAVGDLQEDLADAGKVDDVRVNGVSVVADKIANITMPTKVSDLENDSNYATNTEVSEAVAEGAPIVTEVTKNSLTASDDTYLAQVTSPKKGDVAVISTVVDDIEYEKSSYQYNGTQWVALTGCVDADKVIAREDLVLAGNYTQLGNWTKTQTGTATQPTNGASIWETIKSIAQTTVQPTITAQPAVSGFALSNAGAKEAGTVIASTTFGTASLSTGSYTAFPGQVSTGVTAQSYSVDRVCNPSSMSANGIVEAASGTDNNGGAGFIIGDQGGTNVVSSLQYRVTVTHNAGAVAKDNLGQESNPPVQIAAGSKSQTTSAMTPYRNIFYGTTSSASPIQGSSINSAFVRGLTPTNNAYSARTLTLNVPAGATGVYVACIATATGVTKVINETALNADVTDTFVKQESVMVEGASGYTAVAYNVWHFIPSVSYGNAAVLKVTLG